ncbi:TPA: hypothetical protein NGW16_004209 [Vibrio parahaemolyticus]|nr:hypothetical protein [Vibrio parahaemolyticus]
MNNQNNLTENKERLLDDDILCYSKSINDFCLSIIERTNSEEMKESLLNEEIDDIALKHFIYEAHSVEKFKEYKYYEHIKEYAPYYNSVNNFFKHLNTLIEKIEECSKNRVVNYILENDIHSEDPLYDKSMETFINEITHAFTSINKTVSQIHNQYEQQGFMDSKHNHVEEINKIYTTSIDTVYQNFFMTMNERVIETLKFHKSEQIKSLFNIKEYKPSNFKPQVKRLSKNFKGSVITSLKNLFKIRRKNKKTKMFEVIDSYKGFRELFEAYQNCQKNLREMQLEFNSFNFSKNELESLDSEVKLFSTSFELSKAIIKVINATYNNSNDKTNILEEIDLSLILTSSAEFVNSKIIKS